MPSLGSNVLSTTHLLLADYSERRGGEIPAEVLRLSAVQSLLRSLARNGSSWFTCSPQPGALHALSASQARDLLLETTAPAPTMLPLSDRIRRRMKTIASAARISRRERRLLAVLAIIARSRPVGFP